MSIKKVLTDAAKTTATAIVTGAAASIAPEIYRDVKAGAQSLWAKAKARRARQKAENERLRGGLPPST